MSAEKQNYVVIDGIQVEIEGEKNLLALIRKAGIDMTTFCYHPHLSIHGACRMCMIETERGSLEASCSMPPKPGMVIKTNTERLRRYRRNIIELLLAHHCNDCTTCEFSGDCSLQEYAKRLGVTDIRFPNTAVSAKGADTSSVCISRDSGKCILCGDCVRVCHDVQNVGAIDFTFRGSKMKIDTSFGMPLAETVCVGCGQCAAACPTGALVVKNDIPKVWRAIDDKDVRTSVQVAPAVRVAVGRAFGLSEGDDVMGRIVAALRRLGVDDIYDTTLGADLTVLEESEEFISRIEQGGPLPLLTSCCPGWVQYVEKKRPEFLKNVSTCKSPMQMLSALLADQTAKSQRRTFHFAIMPCTAKKFEASRSEFATHGHPDVDAVLTSQELIRMIKSSGIDFAALEPEAVDMPFGTISGAGVIFGVTGGVTEAVLRRVVSSKTQGSLAAIANVGVRGMEGMKEFTLDYAGREVRVGVVSGLANADAILDRVAAGEKFDLIEVMACPGGCVAGAGQPPASQDRHEQRGLGLYKADKKLSIRRSEENPLIAGVYETMKGRVHELLHVHYKGGEHR